MMDGGFITVIILRMSAWSAIVVSRKYTCYSFRVLTCRLGCCSCHERRRVLRQHGLECKFLKSLKMCMTQNITFGKGKIQCQSILTKFTRVLFVIHL